jgi:1,4-alpha-glucan branching enzyme
MKLRHLSFAAAELDAILTATHGDPFGFLGLHQSEGRWVVRVFAPYAREVAILDARKPKRITVAEKVHGAGFFEAILPEEADRPDYRVRFTDFSSHTTMAADPYSFGPILGEIDLHLFSEGNHRRIYEKLGAHIREIGGVIGTAFAVWAPNAQRVSVVGDFNNWDGRVNPMRNNAGVWEIFLPGVGEGAHYKFEIRTPHGGILLKSDPFAFYNQHGLDTSSMVFDLHRYKWSDDEWMQRRRSKEWQREAVSIYEVHPGSWRRVIEEGNRQLSYREMANQLLDYVVEMGFTHIELMAIAEHPFDGSWGYQVTNYYAPTSRHGNPDEFRYLVDRCHQRGVGVILDWVPGHFPKDAHGLAEFDGTDLFEHSDPRQGEHADWGTLIFNYGRNEVRNFLTANGLFWFDQYHIDGVRVDAVASMLYLDYSRKAGEWIPNAFGGRENLEAIHFMKQFNEVAYGEFPGVMSIAEESTAWPGVSRPTYLGGLGFGFKWNMGWMNDTLRYMALEPIHRRFHQGDATFSLIYAFHEHFILVLSHDEVVHGKGSLLDKMPGDVWQKFANLRMFYAWMWAHPGKKLLFMGGEFGQWEEWKYNRSLDWHLNNYAPHDGLRRLVQHLNFLYKNEPAFYELDDTFEGFEWIDFSDSDNSVLSFARKSRGGDVLLFVLNATPVPREPYRVGAPGAGYYEEILNTDAQTYGGSNVGNCGGLYTDHHWWQGREHSLSLNLPPLSVVGFKRLAEKPAPPAPPVEEAAAAPVPATPEPPEEYLTPRPKKR